MNFVKHDHSDSRLSCIDCSEPICAKCMVQCPVGFRCQKCVSKFKSHLIVISPWIITRTALVCLVIGHVYGWVSPRDGFGLMLNFVIQFFVGALLGKLIHKVAAHKLGPVIVLTVIIGMAVGMIFSPLGAYLFERTMVIGQLFGSSQGGAMDLASHLLLVAGNGAVFIL
ncbi:MAG: hypothetical protein K2X93_21000, partial [Candidatus Obscuribacterales bacterium]|nr:hypothetical protein [Candidatus Obscuribacterales bacterium]